MIRKTIFILLWASAQLILVSQLLFAQTVPQKNIILIAVDDLNDWVGVMKGHPQTLTPNIDKLASKGVLFNNASCASPVCNPSRTAFLTGRRPHETGITNNSDGYFRESSTLWIRNLISWPQYFAQRGYGTASQGKIFHTHEESKGEFQKLGPGGQGCNAGKIVKKVPNTDLIWSQSDQTFTSTGDYQSAEWCGSFLKENHNKPFLLACGLFRPHLPHHAPVMFYNKLPDISDIKLPAYLPGDLKGTFGRSNMTLPEVLNTGGQMLWKETVRAYLANVAFADACVGKLLNDLENSAYKNNTIVVLIGDHGWHLGEKEHFQKFTLWERAVKTPLIIYDPVNGGKGVCDKAVSLMDIFPTLLELTGVPKPTFKTSGYSIAPLVKNPNASWCGAALTSYAEGNHSIRTDRYRYIRYSNGKEELYDHLTDPNEWTNGAADEAYANVLKDHRSLLNQMLNGNEQPLASCAKSENELPKVNITAPSDNISFRKPANVTINVTANDSDGWIKKVEFYQGTTLLGVDAEGPFSFTWNNAPAGNYLLKTIAYDNEGAFSVSTAVSINVQDESPVITDITDLKAVAVDCETVRLKWSNKDFETGFRIRRKLPEEIAFVNISDVAKDVTEYTDRSVVENKSYVYVVRPLIDGTATANSNAADVTIPECIITSIELKDDLKINVFPNPTKDKIYLSDKTEWRLLSPLGSQLNQGEGDELNLSELKEGMYFLQVGFEVIRIYISKD